MVFGAFEIHTCVQNYQPTNQTTTTSKTTTTKKKKFVINSHLKQTQPFSFNFMYAFPFCISLYSLCLCIRYVSLCVALIWITAVPAVFQPILSHLLHTSINMYTQWSNYICENKMPSFHRFFYCIRMTTIRTQFKCD